MARTGLFVSFWIYKWVLALKVVMYVNAALIVYPTHRRTEGKRDRSPQADAEPLQRIEFQLDARLDSVDERIPCDSGVYVFRQPPMRIADFITEEDSTAAVEADDT